MSAAKTMTVEVAAGLRAPFPPEKVGKLPRVTCGACREASSRACDQHKKGRCDDCGAWVSPAHMHLDFVGHADVTDRLLAADPGWTWEPFALDERGLPAVDGNGGMWIRLTIAGVTRIGYGDADGKRGGSAVKETIGDALRNAAMRFGVALDLWRKEVHVEESRPARRPDRQKTIRAAAAAIEKATTKDELETYGLRVSKHEKDEVISTQDAIELRRQIVAKLDELFPAGEKEATGEAS